jgi:hypothetical protein
MKNFFIHLLFIFVSFGYCASPYLNESKIYQEEEIEDTEIIESRISKIDKILSNLSILFNPSYFYQHDKSFRKIYGTGFLPKVEINYNFYNNWSVWVEAAYFSKRGKIKSLDTKTRIYLAPVALGLKYGHYIREDVNFYLKIAPNLSYFKIRKNMGGIKKSSDKTVVFGGVFGGGIIVELRGGWLVGSFLNYSYNKKKIVVEGRRILNYIGGLDVGGSVGYYF